MNSPRKITPERRSGKFEQRVASYAAAAGALLATSPNTKAEVVVWDPDPDPGTGGGFGLFSFQMLTGQINGGSPDFLLFNSSYQTTKTYPRGSYCYTDSHGSKHCYQTFGVRTYRRHYGFARPVGGGAEVVGSSNQVFRLNGGDAIGGSQNFVTGYRLEMGFAKTLNGVASSSAGSWHLGNEGFVGLRFDDTDGTHFGWAEVRRENDSGLTLKRFAYETEPGRPISAGKTAEIPLAALSIARVDSDVVITFGGNRGLTYRLQRKGTPSDDRWTDVTDVVASSDGSNTITDVGGAAQQEAYYRVVLVVP